MKTCYCTSIVLVLLLTFILTGASYSTDISMAPRLKRQAPVNLGSESKIGTSGIETYNGTLRIYMAEPTSRWRDNHNYQYEFGFLDFALVANVSLEEATIWNQTITWNPAAAGFSGVQESNIMAIAVLFNSQPHTADAYPGNGFWFNAYDVDAAAGTTPGNPGRNVTNENFTHTVFVEEATATN